MRWGKQLWVYPLLFLLLFYAYPLLMILQRSLDSGNVTAGWENIKSVVRFSFLSATGQASLSTMITLVIGLPGAYVFSRFQFTGRKLLRILITLPFILPTVVVAAGFNALFGPRGWINLLLMRLANSSQPPLAVMNSLWLVVLAHVFYNVSIVVRIVGAALSQLDPRLEQSAAVLGASPIKRLRKIVFPLVSPAILSALMLIFLFDFTSFGVILLLGGSGITTPEVEIFVQTTQLLNLRAAAVITILQFFCTFTLTIFLSRLGEGWFAPIVPRVNSISSKQPRSMSEKILVGVVVFMLLSLSVLPLLSIIVRAFFQWVTLPDNTFPHLQLSLNGFRNLFFNTRQSAFFVAPVQAVRNSLVIAANSALISLTLGLAATYSIVRFHKENAWLEQALMLPLGTSAVTLGLGYLVSFSGIFKGSQFIVILIPVVHALIGLPFVMRAVRPALQSIPDTILQAGAVLGASPKEIWKKIEYPIIRRALSAGAVFAFTISLGEFGAAMFLARPEWPTITMAIFRFLNQPGESNYSQALAMSVILLLICFVAIICIDRIQEGL